MKIVHLNQTDIDGGAARAAYRIHHALRGAKVQSRMLVNVAASGDWTVEGPASRWGKLQAKLRPLVAEPFRRALRTRNPIIHSPAIIPSHWPERVNRSDAEVVHLHWIAGEMLSIADIGRIEKPMVWTLHDMWAFCGAEHYTTDVRWLGGYRANNRPAYESRCDLNRWTWERKRKHWRRPFQIVTPSQWLAECVRQSSLMGDWPVSVIPNCLDTDRWQPICKRLAREMLGLDSDERILLFGAMGGIEDSRKGFDLLAQAIGCLRGEVKDLKLVIFGQLEPPTPLNLGFPVTYMGHLYDDLSLRVLYSAADVLVVPSRQEVFGQTASEAHACGTPVVAFNTGGLPDIVDHRKTGYLALPFDHEDLASGISWVLSNSEDCSLGSFAREKAVARFSAHVVAEQYRELYLRIVSESRE